MAVTIQQIADLAGVSRGTVDRVLNNRGRVKPEVEKSIKKIIDELGYVAKKTKKIKETKFKIGVVTQLSNAGFMIDINKGIGTAKKELKNIGIEVIVKNGKLVEENEQLKLIDELMKEKINALAIMPVNSEKIRTKLNFIIDEYKIPIVTFNTDIVGTKRLCFVGMDNRKSGKTAAEIFRVLMKETGKILVITGYFSSLLNNLRLDGFIEEIKKIAPNIEIASVQSSFDDDAEVENIIKNSMLNIPGITGIFVVSSGQYGIEKALESLKLEKCPYIIAYDQTPINKTLLEKNMINFLIDQNGFEQGYKPIRILTNVLLTRDFKIKEYLYTEINIKNKYNIKDF